MSAAAKKTVALWEQRVVEDAAEGLFARDATVQIAHPFETMDAGEFECHAMASLRRAFPDLERRTFIRMAGRAAGGATWVGVGGHWVGTFAAPFLDIPPTGRAASIRFHDFFRIEGDRVVEMQGLWDLPELMMQAGVWPMVPSLGREWLVPGPMTQDGLAISGDAGGALDIVGDMLSHLGNNRDGVEAMRLDAFWHPRCAWYGPAGIGTARGIDGFRRHHQIPFLNAMPDRVGDPGAGHFFAEGDYVGFTAWPGMRMTHSGDGWLGIPPMDKAITMRSLDFWRVESGLIRENWVLVDLLDVYAQLGVDVFARMRELPGWTNESA